jgi:diadenosine tetraphosphate (Ap4A) HIT family hydrolase
MKLFESEKTFAFLDISPLSKGHAVSTGPTHVGQDPY